MQSSVTNLEQENGQNHGANSLSAPNLAAVSLERSCPVDNAIGHTAQSEVTVSDDGSEFNIKILVAMLLTPAAAPLASIVAPAFIFQLQQEFGSRPEHARFLDAIFEPGLLAPWVLFGLCAVWLFWNSNVMRMDGKADAKLIRQGKNDPLRVALGLMTCLLFFSGASLVFMAQLPGKKTAPALYWTFTFGIATLLAFYKFFTVVKDAFRKHVEFWARRGVYIKPWPEQPFIRLFYQLAGGKHADRFGVVMREIFPPISGIIRVRAMMFVLSVLSNSRTKMALSVLSVLLIFPVLFSGAYDASQFDIKQIKDGFELFDRDFPMKNKLSRFENGFLKFLGKIQSGAIFMDIIRLFKQSNNTSVNVVLFFSWIGAASVLYKAEVDYIQLGQPIVEGGISAGLAAIGVFKQKKTILELVEFEFGSGHNSEQEQARVVPFVDDMQDVESVDGESVHPLEGYEGALQGGSDILLSKPGRGALVIQENEPWNHQYSIDIAHDIGNVDKALEIVQPRADFVVRFNV